MNKVILDPINLLFTVPMIILATIDFFSQFTENHKDFKSTIVGLGILGTFGGIFLGLQAFDPNKIQESIPPLLEGLKTSFWTSIAGMTISMILTVIEIMFVKKAALGNEFDVLLEIDKNGKSLSSNLSSFQIQQTQSQTSIETINKTLIQLQDTLDKTLEKISDGATKEIQGLQNIEAAINNNFIPLQVTLEKAFEKISEGATKEIIKALEQVIQDFNKNLTDQFGDNFKALNEAVKNMIVWQENYRNNIEDMENGLKAAVTAIHSSETSLGAIASRNEEVINVYNKLEKIVNTMNSQLDQLGEGLGHHTKLFEQATYSLLQAEAGLHALSEKASASVFKIEETIISATNNTSGVAISYSYELTQKIEELARKNEEIISKVAFKNERLFEATMKNFGEIKATIDDLTEKFRNSLSNQSESISKLNEEIKKQLPESLKSLGSALTTLTNQFKTDYEFFLSKIREITSDLHRK